MTDVRGPARREEEAVGVRREEIERNIRELLTADLLDEHRQSPGGRHSPALAHVLAYLRQAPTGGKLALFSPGGSTLRVLRLSGTQGKPHEDLGRAGAGVETAPEGLVPDGASRDDAGAHGVFLRRLRALGWDVPAGAGPRSPG